MKPIDSLAVTIGTVTGVATSPEAAELRAAVAATAAALAVYAVKCFIRWIFPNIRD